MNILKSILLLVCVLVLNAFAVAQLSVTGKLVDDQDEPVGFANVVLYQGESLVKVSTSDEMGKFEFMAIDAGEYKLVATFIGYEDAVVDPVSVQLDNTTNLGKVTMLAASVQLEEAVIKAKRAMVEVKPDRTVFNVEGTINSTGDNGLGLLRKAPGVLVDNNDNISVLGRTGVLVYVDGKRLPLSGDELTAYLETLQADQIDKMEIITNPGARYEAEGNAGIIDIRLKKDKNVGANGSINTTLTQGKRFRGNVGVSGNYRNKRFNTFGSIGYINHEQVMDINFDNTLNGVSLKETSQFNTHRTGINYKIGSDVFMGNHTFGFIISGADFDRNRVTSNDTEIGLRSATSEIDSILIADNTDDNQRQQTTYNLNYVYKKEKSQLNVDLDYGDYTRDAVALQPNRYYSPDRTTLFSENIDRYESPSQIDIYTAKLDFERNIAQGKLGIGGKYSFVSTDNTFLYYDIENETETRNDIRSNQFDYDERVTAGYINYAGSLTQKLSYSAGLRVEHTDATGTLTAYDPDLNEDPVEFDYVSYFPSAGLSYAASPQHNWSLNYGRRINRPDYNVLNPFEEQTSELSFRKGNPFLKPEIVNNVELGYTYNFRYNFKLGYSRTTDQITRFGRPDTRDPRSRVLSWDNLSVKSVLSFNASLPMQINDWWSIYLNAGASYIDNQANDDSVDLQAFSYSIYQQSTFKLGGGFTGELSGYYSGPGIWGGVFEYDPSFSINVGIQKKFLKDKLNVKLSANDLAYEAGWSGTSNFDGLMARGGGQWDSRFVSLSLGYNFGNSNIKSRKRKTGIESESKRTKGDSGGR